MTFLTFDFLFGSASRLSGLRSEQLSPQLEQLPAASAHKKHSFLCSFAVILPPKREKSNIRLPVLDQHAQFIVRMDQRVGIFLKFGPACVDLRGRLSQKPVCLRLRVLYDLISLLFCVL